MLSLVLLDGILHSPLSGCPNDDGELLAVLDENDGELLAVLDGDDGEMLYELGDEVT